MIGPINVLKDKKIRIFKEIDNDVAPIKQYIHPTDTTLKAYVRQLSSSERATSNADIETELIEVIINKRTISTDMYIEFKGKTYEIQSDDNYLFYNTDVKFQAASIIEKQYTDVRWTD